MLKSSIFYVLHKKNIIDNEHCENWEQEKKERMSDVGIFSPCL